MSPLNQKLSKNVGHRIIARLLHKRYIFCLLTLKLGHLCTERTNLFLFIFVLSSNNNKRSKKYQIDLIFIDKFFNIQQNVPRNC